MAQMPHQQTKPSLQTRPFFSEHRIYPTLFSPNGAYLVAGSQDFTLRVFKYPPPTPTPASTTPNPLDLYATLTFPSSGRHWTISDATIDDGSTHMAFSTLPSSRIALGCLHSETATPRVLSIPTGPIWRDPLGHAGTTADLSRWGILSLRFMHGVNCGKVVAGLTDHGIAVVDVQAATSSASDEDGTTESASSSASTNVGNHGKYDTMGEARGVRKIEGAHADDVNAVHPLGTPADVILSGGDDGLIKMWDLRTDTARPIGVMHGHRAGITALDATHDLYGAVSVGKDQCVKVWDARKVTAPCISLTGEEISKNEEETSFDYRFEECPAELMGPAKTDASLKTLRDGQPRGLDGDEDAPGPAFKVSTTLIKARYWPADQRFVAVGSADGRVRVWNVHTGELVRRWEVDSIQDEAAFDVPRDAAQDACGYGPAVQQGQLSRTAWMVRDVSWHPTEPVLAASWWGNQRATRWKRDGAVGGMSVYDMQGCLGEDEEWIHVPKLD